jgi:methyl-accepting chemotaxis protein
MSALHNIPIARKFLYAFGLVCILCVTLGTYTFFTFRNISAQSADISENAFPSLVYVGKIQVAIDRVRRWDLGTLLCQTPACTTKHLEERQNALNDYQTNLKGYIPFIRYPGERELYQKFSSAFDQYVEASNRAQAFLANGKTGDALDLMVADSTLGLLNRALEGATADFELNATSSAAESHQTTVSGVRATWINTVVSLLIVASALWLESR